MKTIDIIAAVLLVVGGLDYGLVGVFDFDLVATLFGGWPLLVSAVYTLVGLAALYQGSGLPWIQVRWLVSPRMVPAS